MRQPNGYGGVSKLSGKRRRPWRARVTDSWIWDETKGKAVQKYRIIGYFAKRADALQALAEFQKQPTAAGTAHLTFSDMYELFRRRNEGRISESSLKTYETNFLKHSVPLHDLRMYEIKTDTMQEVMDATTNGKGSQIQLRSLWNQLFQIAIERDVVHKNYAQFVQLKAEEEPKEKRRPFSKEEIAALWKVVDTLPNAELVLMMIYLGVRPSEFLALRSEHIHLKERYIDVHGTKTKAAARIMPIHSAILPLIARRMGETYLFETQRGKSMHYTHFIRQIWNGVMQELGIEGQVPHTARHTFVSLATAAGVNDRLLKKMVGHSTGDITDVYTHTYIDSLISEVEKIKV